MVISLRNALNRTIEALISLPKVKFTQYLQILLQNYIALTMNMKCCACLSTSSQYQPVAGSEAEKWMEGVFVATVILLLLLILPR